MRKLALTLLTVVLCVSLTGCGMRFTLDLPFKAADITNVEMYHYSDPYNAEKRNIVDKEDIRELYNYFSELYVRVEETKLVTGGEIISFRFNLSDGTEYEIVYYAQAVKSGSLWIPSEELNYFTSADLCALWTSYDQYQAISVSQNELPGVD